MFLFFSIYPELNHFTIDFVQSFLLGIIQGITEFLPISSSAHLKVFPYLLGWNDPGVSISASLQLGSSFAIIFYFRHKLLVLFKSFFSILVHRNIFKDMDTKLVSYIFLANIPIMIVGLLIKIFWPGYSYSSFRSLFSIAIISVVMSLLLAYSEIFSKKVKSITEVTLRDFLLLGLAQSIAVFPGVSRSGITLTSALFSGLKRTTAAELSFLVGIPAISISGLVELMSLYQSSTGIDILPTLIGIISSFISSIVAIEFLLNYLSKHNSFIFVYYRLAFGIFILSTL